MTNQPTRSNAAELCQFAFNAAATAAGRGLQVIGLVLAIVQADYWQGVIVFVIGAAVAGIKRRG